MTVSKERLLEVSQKTGFQAGILEKVLRLLSLLEGLRKHPFLKKRVGLKGGTALNLFYFALPRLSVDIDLNYIGSPDREDMLAERPKVEKALSDVFAREGLSVRRGGGDEHAGGKWSLRYGSSLGGGGNLEVDMNYLHRVPLWDVATRDSFDVGGYRATGIAVLDVHEVAAGKLAALLSRRVARDLFDVHGLLSSQKLDRETLRTAFVVYGGANRKDWRTVSVKEVAFDEQELRNNLMPLLGGHAAREISADPARWASSLVEETRKMLKIVLPLSRNEKTFLNRLNDEGKVDPSLITRDPKVTERIGKHPGLAWKAKNVREYKKRN